MNLLIDYLEGNEEFDAEALAGICEHIKRSGTECEDIKDVLLNFIEAGGLDSEQEDILLDQIQSLDGFDVYRFSSDDEDTGE